jgi:type IV pilus assembly protein PilW
MQVRSRTFDIRPRQRGLTLIELMIAMVLGLMIILGVVSFFITNNQTYRVNEALAKMQENARIALELLSREIRMAGATSCVNFESISPNVIAKPAPLGNGMHTGVALQGFENVTTVAGDGTTVAGTDALLVSRGDECGATLTGNLTARNANIQTVDAQACGWSAGQVMVITDCLSTDIFRASSVSNGASKTTVAHATNVNTDNRLSKAYDQSARVMGYRSGTYYVATRDGVSALVLEDNLDADTTNNPVLADGVADVRYAFGVDANADGSVDAYQGAGAVADWTDVIAVRIDVDMVSQERGLGVTGDGRLTRTFSRTVTVRNRMQ